jgi:hypothetical protein
MRRPTRYVVAGLVGAAFAAAPAAAFGAASDGASCAGQFATSVPGGPVKGEFASDNASSDGRNFGTITSDAFARGPREACPF